MAITSGGGNTKYPRQLEGIKMQTFRTYLSELKSAPLYHGTSLDNILQILVDGKIKASNNGRVSATRSKNNVRASYGCAGYFVLDQVKIQHRPI